MKLPTPLMGDKDFHGFMTQYYAQSGLPFFSQYHAEQLLKLEKMRAKVYVKERAKRRTRLETAKAIFEAMIK